MDPLAFADSDMLTRRYGKLEDVLRHLASAVLILGVPNEFTWMATAFYPKMIILYPDHIPQKRWFAMHHSQFGRLGFQAHAVQIPVMLTGLRTLIRML
jgi:hypothetical protein